MLVHPPERDADLMEQDDMLNATRDLFPGHITKFNKHCSPGHSDECWPWTGPRDKQGYGKVEAMQGKRRVHVGAHRVAYLIYRGDIPVDLVLDHLCRNHACVNPNHLEPVTNAENLRRQPALTMCDRNHPGVETDAYIGSGGRAVCRVCRRIAAKRYKQHLKVTSRPAAPPGT